MRDGFGSPNSNPGWGYLYSLCVNAVQKDMDPSLSHISPVNLSRETHLEKGNLSNLKSAAKNRLRTVPYYWYHVTQYNLFLPFENCFCLFACLFVALKFFNTLLSPFFLSFFFLSLFLSLFLSNFLMLFSFFLLEFLMHRSFFLSLFLSNFLMLLSFFLSFFLWFETFFLFSFLPSFLCFFSKTFYFMLHPLIIPPILHHFFLSFCLSFHSLNTRSFGL